MKGKQGVVIGKYKQEVIVFGFLGLFVILLMLAKEFSLLGGAGQGQGQGQGKKGDAEAAGKENPGAEDDSHEPETAGPSGSSPRTRRAEDGADRLAGLFRAGSGRGGRGEPGAHATPPAGAGRSTRTVPVDFGRGPLLPPLPSTRKDRQEELLAHHLRKVMAALHKVPGDHLLRREARLNSIRSSREDERVGFLVRTPLGDLLVPSLWRIRQGVLPRCDERVRVRLDAVAGLDLRLLIVRGPRFKGGGLGSVGIDGRSGAGGRVIRVP